MPLSTDDLEKIRQIVREEAGIAALVKAIAKEVVTEQRRQKQTARGEAASESTDTTPDKPGAPRGRLISGADLAEMLGYSRKTLAVMRSTGNPVLAGLPMFKVCDCEATRRKTQARCTHPYYAFESDVLAFFRSRQQRFEAAKTGNGTSDTAHPPRRPGRKRKAP